MKIVFTVILVAAVVVIVAIVGAVIAVFCEEDADTGNLGFAQEW